MCQQLLYVLALSDKTVHSYSFVPLTGSSNWPGIGRAVLPKIPQDRLDLSVRVFIMNLRAMMQYVIGEKLLGNLAAYLSALNFQKRCPHQWYCRSFEWASKQQVKRSKSVDDWFSLKYQLYTGMNFRKWVRWHHFIEFIVLYIICLKLAWKMVHVMSTFQTSFKQDS